MHHTTEAWCARAISQMWSQQISVSVALRRIVCAFSPLTRTDLLTAEGSCQSCSPKKVSPAMSMVSVLSSDWWNVCLPNDAGSSLQTKEVLQSDVSPVLWMMSVLPFEHCQSCPPAHYFCFVFDGMLWVASLGCKLRISRMHCLACTQSRGCDRFRALSGCVRMLLSIFRTALIVSSLLPTVLTLASLLPTVLIVLKTTKDSKHGR